jgi:hypothetical protein
MLKLQILNISYYFEYKTHILHILHIFPVEKLRYILNSRNEQLLIFFTKPTFKNWVHVKL